MHLLKLHKSYENYQDFKIQHNHITACLQDRTADVGRSALQHPPKPDRVVSTAIHWSEGVGGGSMYSLCHQGDQSSSLLNRANHWCFIFSTMGALRQIWSRRGWEDPTQADVTVKIFSVRWDLQGSIHKASWDGYSPELSAARNVWRTQQAEAQHGFQHTKITLSNMQEHLSTSNSLSIFDQINLHIFRNKVSVHDFQQCVIYSEVYF